MELLLDWFFPNGIKTNEAILLIIGFVGQGLFSARFLIQWVVSEKNEKALFHYLFGILGCLEASHFSSMHSLKRTWL